MNYIKNLCARVKAIVASGVKAVISFFADVEVNDNELSVKFKPTTAYLALAAVLIWPVAAVGIITTVAVCAVVGWLFLTCLLDAMGRIMNFFANQPAAEQAVPAEPVAA